MNLSINAKLPNGAIILAYTVVGDHGVILANTGKSGTPFVTWAFYNNDLRSTCHGHYFETLPEAYQDFRDRVGHTPLRG